MQRAGSQLAVAGVERALIRAVLDSTKQVVVGRVRLEHHWRAAIKRMADDQAWAVLFFKQLPGLRIRTVFVDQLLYHRLQQIDLHGLQISLNAGVFAILL